MWSGVCFRHYLQSHQVRALGVSFFHDLTGLSRRSSKAGLRRAAALRLSSAANQMRGPSPLTLLFCRK